MPLSEDEQRILRQIEEQLQRDPGFGRTLHHHDAGNRRVLIGSGIAAVVGLVLTVALLSVSPYLSFVAFVGALAAALVCERHARSLGEAGLGHLSDTMRGKFGQATHPRSDD
jgi:membrane protein implicated in regulation of membrane protease activity